MNNPKCPHCGLVNFASAAACKRCGADLSPAGSYAGGHQASYAHAHDFAAAPAAEPAPPRTLGVLLTILGVLLSFSGAYLLAMGHPSPYFMVVGVGIAVSGFLIASGRLAGVYVYYATYAVIVAWSLVETAGATRQLGPRVFIPTLIALHLTREKVRSRLS
ncbi:MAG TPA: hypothetical protein VN282_26945 [Pyrinomonadaceae bacterium]|nr:hypothetical protein [Pyrinomonadaceae bacterium]